MFDFDSLREIWSTMKKNKLRTFLTGFSVAWGIFMLIVLLGAGNGLGNGIAHNFRNMAENTVTCWSRYTTLPYKGFLPNRRIRFTEEDVHALKQLHPEIDRISPDNYRNDTISFGQEYFTGGIQSVYPDFASIIYIPVLAGNGRFINEVDLQERRKVVVISPRIAEILFRDSVQAVGSHVKIGNLMFQVIGIYKDENNSSDSPAYIPFTTGRLLYANDNPVQRIRFTLRGINSQEAEDAFMERYRLTMARRHQFDPDDKNAIGWWTTGSEFRMWQGMNNGIALFIWIVGIGTLMAGIVGVSNIMLITVRERTKEFGIRKAIGAKPSSILRLIIVESVLVTAVFGYIGMVTGIGLTELINYGMEMAGVGSGGSANPEQNTTVFRNPTVDLGIALAATGVLIVAGVLAGYFPARKAVKITAIEAMRQE
ncbi:ABC transporter permease [Parabacteroides sp. PF5-6]|uniref:ABC transporter permease n=1 Tax=Parabacteroides sp. PF5-6 TaxID=1742403 RepID=UPI002407730E|nr:ABC transporter permease [Parabacteroides sp. PF5-6]MDF9829449.1 putative ABC transport system permease protein [Parabacteroides sp. PF5-6]